MAELFLISALMGRTHLVFTSLKTIASAEMHYVVQMWFMFSSWGLFIVLLSTYIFYNKKTSIQNVKK